MLQLPFPIIHSIYMKFKNLKLGGRSFEASVTLRQQQTVQTLLCGITPVARRDTQVTLAWQFHAPAQVLDVPWAELTAGLQELGV